VDEVRRDPGGDAGEDGDGDGEDLEPERPGAGLEDG
jgi:hypothetical protein